MLKRKLALLLVATLLTCLTGVIPSQARPIIKPEKIILSTTSLSLFRGEYATLSVESVVPENASKSVCYCSCNTNVACVSRCGEIRANRPGKTKIVVTSCYDRRVKATCDVTVYDGVKNRSIELNKNISRIQVTGTDQLYVARWVPSLTPSKKVTWKSSNPLIATVSEDGVVTGIKKGVVTITATNSYKNWDRCRVEVSEFVPTPTPTRSPSPTIVPTIQPTIQPTISPTPTPIFQTVSPVYNADKTKAVYTLPTFSDLKINRFDSSLILTTGDIDFLKSLAMESIDHTFFVWRSIDEYQKIGGGYDMMLTGTIGTLLKNLMVQKISATITTTDYSGTYSLWLQKISDTQFTFNVEQITGSTVSPTSYVITLENGVYKTFFTRMGYRYDLAYTNQGFDIVGETGAKLSFVQTLTGYTLQIERPDLENYIANNNFVVSYR